MWCRRARSPAPRRRKAWPFWTRRWPSPTAIIAASRSAERTGRSADGAGPRRSAGRGPECRGVGIGLAGRCRMVGNAEIKPVHRVQPAAGVTDLVTGESGAHIGVDVVMTAGRRPDLGVEPVSGPVEIGPVGRAQADAARGL